MAEMEATATENFDFVMAPVGVAQAEVRPVDGDEQIPDVRDGDGSVASGSVEAADAGVVEPSAIPEAEPVQVDQAAVPGPDAEAQQVGPVEMPSMENSGPDRAAEMQVSEADPVGQVEVREGEQFSATEQAGIPPVEVENVEAESAPAGEEFHPAETAEMSGPDDSVSVQPVELPASEEFSPPSSQPISGDEWSPQQVADAIEPARYSIGEIAEGVDSPDGVSMEFSNHVDTPNFHEIAENELNRFRANLEEMVGSQMERMANVALTVAHSASVDMAMMLEARHHQ